jgi:hypothetical protein
VTTTKLPALVTTAVAAAFLDLPASTIRTYCDRGVLRSRRFGRAVQVYPKSLRDYAATRKPAGRPAKQGGAE